MCLGVSRFSICAETRTRSGDLGEEGGLDGSNVDSDTARIGGQADRIDHSQMPVL